MSDAPKEATKAESAPQKAAPKAADPIVLMKHEFATYKHKVAIGEEWFEVGDDGLASFPLRLIEGAELAGFRRVV